MAPENLPRQTLRAIAIDRRAQLPRGSNAKTLRVPAIFEQEDRHEAAGDARAFVIDALEFRPTADPLVRPESLSGHSSATVSRLRPFARRRLSTIRPFFVDIRTRKPWVFFRRRVFG